MNEQLAERLNRSWDENARAWTATVRGGLIESRRIATDAAILNAVRNLSPERVLDVGCGEGWLCRALNEAGIECIGLDGSADLIAAAREADRSGVYHLVRYADIDRALGRVEVGSFDVAICNFSLLHEEIGSILGVTRAALRPGGTLLIQTVHPWSTMDGQNYVDGWRTEEFTWASGTFPEQMPWYFRTLESWIAALNEAGYTIARLAEPRHPETQKPLSLILSASRPGV